MRWTCVIVLQVVAIPLIAAACIAFALTAAPYIGVTLWLQSWRKALASTPTQRNP